MGDSSEEEKEYKRNVSYDFKDPHTRHGKKKGPVQIRFKTNFRNTLYDVCKSRPGWKYTEADMDWDTIWCERDWMFKFYDHVHLESWQRVNHYRNQRELCRKDLMYRNIVKHRRKLEREKKHAVAAEFDFVPSTFVLPGDYAIFVQEFKRRPGLVWIMKPVGRAQGKGIFLFKKLSEINSWKRSYRKNLSQNNSYSTQRSGGGGGGANSDDEEEKVMETYVVQRYIDKPHLVGGKKYDMRLYMLCLNYNPLTLYIYRRGFARFSSTHYQELTAKNIEKSEMHLTNVAVQKKSDTYNIDTGGKWFVDDLKNYIAARHGSDVANRAFYDCNQLMIRSLEAVAGVMINDKHCFELYGFDIMFDHNLKPWLIEVNAAPSLTANTPEDYQMKFQMLDEMYDIIDLEKKYEDLPPRDRHGGFDCVYRGTQLVKYPTSSIQSYLGTQIPKHNPRQAKRLRAKSSSSRVDGGGGGGGGAARGGEGVANGSSSSGSPNSSGGGSGAKDGANGSRPSSSQVAAGAAARRQSPPRSR